MGALLHGENVDGNGTASEDLANKRQYLVDAKEKDSATAQNAPDPTVALQRTAYPEANVACALPVADKSVVAEVPMNGHQRKMPVTSPLKRASRSEGPKSAQGRRSNAPTVVAQGATLPQISLGLPSPPSSPLAPLAEAEKNRFTRKHHFRDSSCAVSVL